MRVWLRIVCGMGLLWHGMSASVAQPVPVLIPRLPMVRPAPKVVSLNLAGIPPKAYQKDAITLEIDASLTLAKSVPKLWLGISGISSNVRLDKSSQLDGTLSTSGVEFVRIHADGSPKQLLEDADALFLPLKALGVNIVLCLGARSAASIEIASVLKTLSAPKYGVVRWELKGNWRDDAERYAEFARIVRRVAPTSPVGFYADRYHENQTLPLPETPEVTRFLRMLVKEKIPCDSLAWRAEANAVELTRHLQITRKVLAKYPALKGMILWIDLPDAAQSQTHSKVWDAILPYVSGAIPNAVAGFTVGHTDVSQAENSQAKQGKDLVLRQRLSGILLQSPTASPLVKVAATQQGKMVSVLLMGTKGSNAIPHSVTLRLKNLPDIPASGWRISRYDELSAWSALPAKKGKKQWILRPVAVSDTTATRELELNFVMLSDDPIILEIRPHSMPTIKTSLACDRLVCRAGETITLDVLLRNMTSKVWSGKSEMTGTLAGFITKELRSVSIAKLLPDKPQLKRYQIRVPVVAEDTTTFVNFAINGTRSSLELRILAALKTTLMTPRIDLDAPGGTAETRLLLINRSQTDLTLNIAASNDLFPLILHKGKESVQTVPITIRERNAGVYFESLSVNYGDQSLAAVKTYIGVPYLCRYATLKPNIDGELGEWTDAAPMGMGRQDQVRGMSWSSPTEFSAYAYTKWDESFFYFACAVTDATFESPSLDNLATTGDSVAFAVTRDPMLTNSEQGYGTDDMEFCFALSGDGQTHLLRARGTNAHPAGRCEKAMIAIKRNGSRTFYEAAIPWQELGMTPPEEKRKFGFTVLANDKNASGRGAIVWSDGIYNEKRPFLFPPLRLGR